MSPVVVEVASWPASEAFKADQTLIYPALTILAGLKGAQKLYYGIQHEDQATARLIIIWESLAHHQALIDDKPTYEKLGATLAPVLGGGISLYHVKFVAPESIPVQFDAPITEFVIQTIKDTAKASDLEAHLATADGFSSGKVVEYEKQWVLIKGWQSLEEHEAYVKEHLGAFGSTLVQLVDLELKHWKFTAFKL